MVKMGGIMNNGLAHLQRFWQGMLAATAAIVLAACGGGDDAPPLNDVVRIGPIVVAEVSTDGVDFGEVRTSNIGVQTFQVRNTGDMIAELPRGSLVPVDPDEPTGQQRYPGPVEILDGQAGVFDVSWPDLRSASGDFVLDANGVRLPVTRLLPGQSLQVDVSFSPEATVLYEDTLRISVLPPARAVAVTLQGQGQGSPLAVNVGAQDIIAEPYIFPRDIAPGARAQAIVQLFHTGGAGSSPVTLTSNPVISITGTAEDLEKFQIIQQPANIIIPPGGDTTFVVEYFASPNTNPAQVELSFISEDAGGSYGTTSFDMFAGDPEEFLVRGRADRFIANNTNNIPSEEDGTDLGSGEYQDVLSGEFSLDNASDTVVTVIGIDVVNDGDAYQVTVDDPPASFPLDPLEPGQAQEFNISATVFEGIEYNGVVEITYIFGVLPPGQTVDDLDESLIETYSHNITGLGLVQGLRVTAIETPADEADAEEQVLSGFDQEPTAENNTHFGTLHVSSIIRDKDRSGLGVSRSFANRDFKFRLDNPGNTPLSLGRVHNDNQQALAVSFVDPSNWTIVGYQLDGQAVSEAEFNAAILRPINPLPGYVDPTTGIVNEALVTLRYSPQDPDYDQGTGTFANPRLELPYGANPQRVETVVEFIADDPRLEGGRFPVKLAGDRVNSNLQVYFYDRFVNIPTKSEIVADGRVPGALEFDFYADRRLIRSQAEARLQNGTDFGPVKGGRDSLYSVFIVRNVGNIPVQLDPDRTVWSSNTAIFSVEKPDSTVLLTTDGSDSSWTYFAVQFEPSTSDDQSQYSSAINLGITAPLGDVEVETNTFAIAGNSIFPVDTFANFDVFNQPEELENQRSIIFPLPEETLSLPVVLPGQRSAPTPIIIQNVSEETQVLIEHSDNNGLTFGPLRFRGTERAREEIQVYFAGLPYGEVNMPTELAPGEFIELEVFYEPSADEQDLAEVELVITYDVSGSGEVRVPVLAGADSVVTAKGNNLLIPNSVGIYEDPSVIQPNALNGTDFGDAVFDPENIQTITRSFTLENITADAIQIEIEHDAEGYFPPGRRGDTNNDGIIDVNDEFLPNGFRISESWTGLIRELKVLQATTPERRGSLRFNVEWSPVQFGEHGATITIREMDPDNITDAGVVIYTFFVKANGIGPQISVRPFNSVDDPVPEILDNVDDFNSNIVPEGSSLSLASVASEADQQFDSFERQTNFGLLERARDVSNILDTNLNGGVSQSQVVRTFEIVNTGFGDLELRGTPPVQVFSLTEDGGIPGQWEVVEQPDRIVLAEGERTTFQVAFNPHLTATEAPIDRNEAADDPRRRRGIVRIETNDPVNERTRFQFLVDGWMTEPRITMYCAQFIGDLQRIVADGPDHINNMVFEYDPGDPLDPSSEFPVTPIVDQQSPAVRSNGTNFGSISIGTESSQHVFVLRKLDDIPLRLTDTPETASIVGVDAADFEIVRFPQQSELDESGETYLTVVFKPSGPFERNATLQIGVTPDEDLDGNPTDIDSIRSTNSPLYDGVFTAELRGTGSGPKLEIIAVANELSADVTVDFPEADNVQTIPRGSTIGNEQTKTRYLETYLVHGQPDDPETTLVDNIPANRFTIYQLTNTGNAALDFDSSIDQIITITGARDGDFFIHNNLTNFDDRPVSQRLPTPANVDPALFVDSLAPGQSAYFTLWFAPVPISSGEEAEISERTATITIASNDRNPDRAGENSNPTSFSYVVNGTGIDPKVVIKASAGPIADRDASPARSKGTLKKYVDIHQGSVTQTFTIENASKFVDAQVVSPPFIYGNEYTNRIITGRVSPLDSGFRIDIRGNVDHPGTSAKYANQGVADPNLSPFYLNRIAGGPFLDSDGNHNVYIDTPAAYDASAVTRLRVGDLVTISPSPARGIGDGLTSDGSPTIGEPVEYRNGIDGTGWYRTEPDELGNFVLWTGEVVNSTFEIIEIPLLGLTGFGIADTDPITARSNGGVRGRIVYVYPNRELMEASTPAPVGAAYTHPQWDEARLSASREVGDPRFWDYPGFNIAPMSPPFLYPQIPQPGGWTTHNENGLTDLTFEPFISQQRWNVPVEPAIGWIPDTPANWNDPDPAVQYRSSGYVLCDFLSADAATVWDSKYLVTGSTDAGYNFGLVEEVDDRGLIVDPNPGDGLMAFAITFDRDWPIPAPHDFLVFPSNKELQEALGLQNEADAEALNPNAGRRYEIAYVEPFTFAEDGFRTNTVRVWVSMQRPGEEVTETPDVRVADANDDGAEDYVIDLEGTGNGLSSRGYAPSESFGFDPDTGDAGFREENNTGVVDQFAAFYINTAQYATVDPQENAYIELYDDRLANNINRNPAIFIQTLRPGGLITISRAGGGGAIQYQIVRVQGLRIYIQNLEAPLEVNAATEMLPIPSFFAQDPVTVNTFNEEGRWQYDPLLDGPVRPFLVSFSGATLGQRFGIEFSETVRFQKIQAEIVDGPAPGTYLRPGESTSMSVRMTPRWSTGFDRRYAVPGVVSEGGDGEGTYVNRSIAGLIGSLDFNLGGEFFTDDSLSNDIDEDVFSNQTLRQLMFTLATVTNDSDFTNTGLTSKITAASGDLPPLTRATQPAGQHEMIVGMIVSDPRMRVQYWNEVTDTWDEAFEPFRDGGSGPFNQPLPFGVRTGGLVGIGGVSSSEDTVSYDAAFSIERAEAVTDPATGLEFLAIDIIDESAINSPPQNRDTRAVVNYLQSGSVVTLSLPGAIYGEIDAVNYVVHRLTGLRLLLAPVTRVPEGESQDFPPILAAGDAADLSGDYRMSFCTSPLGVAASSFFTPRFSLGGILVDSALFGITSAQVVEGSGGTYIELFDDKRDNICNRETRVILRSLQVGDAIEIGSAVDFSDSQVYQVVRVEDLRIYIETADGNLGPVPLEDDGSYEVVDPENPVMPYVVGFSIPFDFTSPGGLTGPFEPIETKLATVWGLEAYRLRSPATGTDFIDGKNLWHDSIRNTFFDGVGGYVPPWIDFPRTPIDSPSEAVVFRIINAGFGANSVGYSPSEEVALHDPGRQGSFPQDGLGRTAPDNPYNRNILAMDNEGILQLDGLDLNEIVRIEGESSEDWIINFLPDPELPADETFGVDQPLELKPRIPTHMLDSDVTNPRGFDPDAFKFEVTYSPRGTHSDNRDDKGRYGTLVIPSNDFATWLPSVANKHQVRPGEIILRGQEPQQSLQDPTADSSNN